MVPSHWKLVYQESEIKEAITKLATIIDSNYNDKDIVLASILKGAVYFTVDLSRQLKTNHSLYFIDASSYDNQTQSDVTINTKITERFKNKHIILLDELYDNGKTLYTVKEFLSNFSESITTCVLFRKNRETEYPNPDLVGIDNIYDVWYVGYGLDDNGKLRNLTDLYAVPKADGIPETSDDKLIFGI